jgi:SAM-dependent methyltransferase
VIFHRHDRLLYFIVHPSAFILSATMLPRKLEPEVMDTALEAADYNAMDHSEVNRVFVDDFLAAARSHDVPNFFDDEQPASVLDVGTGTALIPIELCTRPISCRVKGIDLATEMLKLGQNNIEQAGLTDRITIEQVDAKQMPYPTAWYDAVISNSIVHHIPRPGQVLAEMLRVLYTGGLLFVRDLVRPDNVETLDQIVQAYAGDENAHQQQMFRDSLHAALTLDEIRGLLSDLNVSPAWAQQTTDRHWTVVGQPV